MLAEKTAKNSGKQQRNSEGASLLFRPSVAWKPRISAENARPLAVNFWKNSENSERRGSRI
jgi:hypothetical protein